VVENGARVVWREGSGVAVEEDLGVDGDMVVVVVAKTRKRSGISMTSGHVDITLVIPIGGEGQICVGTH